MTGEIGTSLIDLRNFSHQAFKVATDELLTTGKPTWPVHLTTTCPGAIDDDFAELIDDTLHRTYSDVIVQPNWALNYMKQLGKKLDKLTGSQDEPALLEEIKELYNQAFEFLQNTCNHIVKHRENFRSGFTDLFSRFASRVCDRELVDEQAKQ